MIKFLLHHKLILLHVEFPSIFHWWLGRFQLQDCIYTASVVWFDANFWLKILNLHLRYSRCHWGREVESVSKHVHVDYVMTLLITLWEWLRMEINSVALVSYHLFFYFYIKTSMRTNTLLICGDVIFKALLIPAC